jgi:hypothetical protein
MWWHNTLIPATKETENRRMWFKASLGKKLVRLPSQQNKSGMVRNMSNTSYSRGIGRRTTVYS